MNQALCTPCSTLPGPLPLGLSQVLSRFYHSRGGVPCWCLHKDVSPGVRQPQTHQASPDQHRWGHEDGDGLGDANKRAKNQVPQHCSQLTQSVAEAKACSPGKKKIQGIKEAYCGEKLCSVWLNYFCLNCWKSNLFSLSFRYLFKYLLWFLLQKKVQLIRKLYDFKVSHSIVKMVRNGSVLLKV